MSNDYAKNKVHYYNWIEKNGAKYRENNRIQNAKKNIKRTAWRQACKMYRFILIDEHH
jgi:hypothetical protein